MFHRRYFKAIVLCKLWYLDSNLPEICRKDPVNNKPVFGSENGLVLNKRTVIILTSDGMFYWRIYESPGPGELGTLILKPNHK